MSLKHYVVYLHTNNFNKKKYVGITSNEPKKRWQNGRGYIHNEHFHRAIKKYGWNNFTHDIGNLFMKAGGVRDVAVR